MNISRRTFLKTSAIIPVVAVAPKAEAFVFLPLLADFAISLIARSVARFTVSSITRVIVNQGVRQYVKNSAFSAIALSEIEAMTADAAAEQIKARLFATKVGYSKEESQSVCAIWECGNDNHLSIHIENTNNSNRQLITDFLVVVQDVKTEKFEHISKMKLVFSKKNHGVINFILPVETSGIKRVFGVATDHNVATAKPILVLAEKHEVIEQAG